MKYLNASKFLIIIFLFVNPDVFCQVLSQGQGRSAIEKIKAAKIKKSSSYKYLYKSGMVDPAGTLFNSKQFDSLGKITEETTYAFENMGKKTVMIYDNKGKLIEKDYYNTFYNSPTVTLAGKYTYGYNKNDSLVEWDSYSFDGKIINKCLIKFDSSNYKTEETLYNSDGKISTNNFYINDKKGNCIEYKQYPGEGIYPYESGKYTYTFNSKGRPTTKRCIANQKNSETAEEFASVIVYSYKYDYDGNITEESMLYEIHPSLKGKSIVSSYKYDYSGNLIEESYVDNVENNSYKETYKNDANGNVIEETYFNETGAAEYVIKTIYDK